MKKKYELTVIFGENDPEKKDGIAFVESVLAKHNAAVEKKDEIGLRMLAYEIKKCVRGFYIFYLLDAESDEINKITAEFSISHLILRYLFVCKDELTAKQKEKKEKKDARMKEMIARKMRAQAEETAPASAAVSETEKQEKDNE